jgi:hypothetical protein
MSIEAEAAREESASPKRGRGARRRIRNAIPLVLVLVVLAELFVRALAPRIEDPLLWPDWEAQNKVAAMDKLASSRGGASVVFVGSSMVNAGVNPDLATKLLGLKRPAFNAALNGSDMRTTAIWTRHVVVPRLHPKIVVVGFNSGELNDHWQTPDSLYTKMLQSPLGRRAAGAGAGGVFARIDGWLIDHSYLVRYRSVLRNPWEAAFGQNKAQITQAVDHVGRLNAIVKFQQRPYAPGLSRQLGIWDTVFRNYRPGGKQFAALDGMVRDLTAQGIKVVLVRMPVTKDVIPLHPKGQADRERFGAVLAAFVASHRVTFLNAEATIGGSTSLFVDPLHLNLDGAKRVTTFVIETLKKPA